MATKLDDKQQQDNQYSPYNYDYGLNSDLRQAEQQASSQANTDQTADDLLQSESAAIPNFKNSFTGKVKGFGGGKKAGIAGGISALIIAGVTAFFVNQLGLSLPSIADPIDEMNNTLADAYQNRAPKVLARLLGGNELCSNGQLGLRCKTSQVSNKTLHNLEKQGITANFDDGTSYKKGTRKGFPDKKPISYTFHASRQNPAVTVRAENLASFLSEPKNINYSLKATASSPYRAEVWRGKVLNKLFTSFNLKFNGARDFKKAETAKETYRSAYKTMQKDTPDIKQVQDVTSRKSLESKMDDMSKKLGKGGAAYITLAGGCLAVKAPSIVAASVAAVQMARMAPVFNSLILSPASHQRVSGVDKDNAITGDQLASVMTVLTHKTPRASDGKMTSALDSPILLSAMGVNHNKPALNANVSPGYSVLSTPFVVEGQNISKSTEPYCNFMLNPVTMYTFATADAAVSIGSGLVTGGTGTALTKALGQVLEVGISYAASQAAVIVGQMALKSTVDSIVEKNTIGTAEGELLGDVLGTSAMLFYSSGSLARGLPVMSQAQLPSFVRVQAQVDARQQTHDIATLSPFDTSSKYTFMGSIKHNIQSFAFANQLYTDNSLYSTVAAMTSLPSTLLNPSVAGAASLDNPGYCSYAAEFGLSTGDPATTPAINAAGLPCTGITEQQADMSIGRAIDIMEKEGWINTLVDYPQDATPEELIGTVIAEDSPLATYIQTCGHPETGNFIFESAGCMFPGSSSGAGRDTANNKNYCAANSCIEGGYTPGDTDMDSMRAMPVFLMDYQASQIFQGINSTEDPAPVAGGDESANDDSPAGGGQISGTASQLAQQLLDNPNVTYWDQDRDKADKSRPSDNLRSIAAGELANTSTRGPAGGKQTTIDVNLLKFLVELAKNNKIMINALAGQKHSANSKHYDGTAVDFNCGNTLNQVADPIAKKYGLQRNWENCTAAGNYHWHYSVMR